MREVLADVLDAAPADRASLLETACATDSDLRQQLDALLPPTVRLGALLELPPAPTLAAGLRRRSGSREVPARLSAGSRIGPYEIVRPLGAGGMGEVYLAADPRLGRQVALKCVSRRIAADPLARARTFREARAAARLSHPAIAGVFDVLDHDDGTVVIVMEYVEGQSLGDRLKRGPCGPLEAVDVAIAVADALTHAHEAGIVHCDIKPANIQLTRGGVKVLDFGIARSLFQTADAPTATSDHVPRIAGTPGYMSPEQALGRPVDGRSDVFSLGVVLFEMLAGRRPFEAADRWLEPLQAVLAEAKDIERLRGRLPAGLLGILQRALQRDPDRRFGTAQELLEALRLVRPTLVPRSWQETLRRPRVMAAALAVVAAAALTVYAWREWTAPGSMAIAPLAARWYEQGVAALQEGAYLQAARALERAAQIDAAYPLTWARLGEAQLELDQEGAARQSLLRASSLIPNRSRLPADDRLALEGAMALAGRDADTALGAYGALTERHPSTAPHLLDLGRAQEAASATAEARETYRRASALDPDNPAPHLRLGIINARLQDIEEAEQAFAKAEELYRARSRIEGVATALYERGVMLHRIDRAAEARAVLERARQLAESIESPYLLAAIAFKSSSVAGSQGRFAEAEKLALEARQLSRDFDALHAFGLVDVGNVYLYDDRPDAAEATFREARNRAMRAGASRAEARARLALAALLVARGGVDESEAEAKAALTYYERTGFVAQQTLARTVLIRAQERKGDLAGAQANYEALLRSAGERGSRHDLAEAHYSLCGVLLHRERYAAALDHCERGLQGFVALESPYDIAHAMLRRADLLRRLGRLDDAERELAALFAPGSGTGESTASLERARAQQRANVALARDHVAEAARIARAALRRDGADEELQAGLRRLLALALARSGRPAEAQPLIDQARQGAAGSDDLMLRSQIELARADILLALHRHEEALGLAAPLAEGFDRQERHESAWLAASLAAAAATGLGRAGDAARWQREAERARAQFAAQFTADGWRVYTERADVGRLLRKGAGA